MSAENTETHDENRAKSAMDDMYRWTRHVYDISRKYFLLGRDHLINELSPDKDEYVCEVGCGTARNLIKMARTYPDAHFCGLDASDEMLKTARKSIDQAGVCLTVKQGFAQSFDPNMLFGISSPINKLVFSYSLSIIPPWRESIDHALNILPSGGEMHIVDFGGMEDLPPLFRRFMFWFLDKFHVYHKPEILEYLQKLETEERGTLSIEKLYKGYSYIAVFKKL